MKHQLSFGKINILEDSIAEVIINHNVKISIEMIEECDQFLSEHFSDSFGVLVNKIYTYDYTYEAKLMLGSHEKLKAIAVVNYHSIGVVQSDKIAKLRASDHLNIKVFSGLDLGWQQAYEWLKQELSVIRG